MADNPHEVEIALLQKELTSLRNDVHSLSKDISGLLEAWKTASGVVSFVKWLSGIITAFGIVWAGFKVKFGG